MLQVATSVDRNTTGKCHGSHAVHHFINDLSYHVKRTKLKAYICGRPSDI